MRKLTFYSLTGGREAVPTGEEVVTVADKTVNPLMDPDQESDWADTRRVNEPGSPPVGAEATALWTATGGIYA